MSSGYSPLFTLGLLADPVRPILDDASPIYFSLKAGKRDTIELRSFLYLDLADNKQPLSPCHKRKFSNLSKSTSWACITDAKSVRDLVRTKKSTITRTPLVPVVPARRRTSKESLRNIPSPKPAPSATLPDLPTVSPPALPSSHKKRPVSTIASSLLSPPRRVRRPALLRSESISSHDRRKSRMDALACLEGRSRTPGRIPRSTLRNNFMSFSDDEDERSMSRRSAALSAPPTPSAEDLSAFADVEDEVDAIMPAMGKREAEVRPAPPAKATRKRRGTIDSWFPLKSFIDFKDDDLSSWNWRSFIEIGGVA